MRSKWLRLAEIERLLSMRGAMMRTGERMSCRRSKWRGQMKTPWDLAGATGLSPRRAGNRYPPRFLASVRSALSRYRALQLRCQPYALAWAGVMALGYFTYTRKPVAVAS